MAASVLLTPNLKVEPPSSSAPGELPAGLRRYVEAHFGARLTRVERLGPDAGAGTSTAKTDGYGLPMHLWLERPDGSQQQLVFRLAGSNRFGHDRRSDRAQEQLLAFDTFGLVDRHVHAVDVGAIDGGGELTSLSRAQELFLITEWVDGTPYAEDLRALAHGGTLRALDVQRTRALASHLAALHQRLPPDAVAWERCLRDTVGSGEGLFGVCDAYPEDTPGASPARLLELEQLATQWRWRLKPKVHRLSRTHGDFHPFNLVFREGLDFSLLDASRGAQGESADDVTALAINYVFFALEHRHQWSEGFGVLWDTLWSTYLEHSGDEELLDCVAPFLAWRAVVVACPRFYPHLSAVARERLLTFALEALAAPRFDPGLAHRLFP
ncbi:MAG: aminoglycoside phosphotransferase family protein [Myxococcaceae bacterium]|nr:aminoglycoside phosphotransferase family protein [Myxococcaceae bacterium]